MRTEKEIRESRERCLDEADANEELQRPRIADAFRDSASVLTWVLGESDEDPSEN